MKRTLGRCSWRTIILLISAISIVSLESNYAYPKDNAKNIYYCTGPKSKRYHRTKDCKGLKHCSGEIRMSSKTNAINRGLTPCRYCYKK